MEISEPLLTRTRLKSTGRDLKRKIRERSAKLGVIGLGFTGLDLAVKMARAGFQVTAIDMDRRRVESVNSGTSHSMDINSETLRAVVTAGNLRATQSFAAVEAVDAVSICVPAPLTVAQNADLSYMLASVEAVHNHLTPGKLIVLESIIPPGTTRNIVLPILQKSGRVAGEDFFLAYAPKRRHIGKKTSGFGGPQVIMGGVTSLCSALGAFLHCQFARRILRVSSVESAEMVSFFEAAVYNVNRALVHEMANLCSGLGIEIMEMTKALNFPLFECETLYPQQPIGQGPIKGSVSAVGIAKPLLLQVAEIVNSKPGALTFSRIAEALNKTKKSINGSHVLVLGISVSHYTGSVRETCVLDTLRLLHEKGAIVSYHDPDVVSLEVGGETLTSTAITSETLRTMDCVVFLADDLALDYSIVVANSRLIIDCRKGAGKQ
jgi:UDP-N-acetyl-D-glucosamine dehydrogenase